MPCKNKVSDIIDGFRKDSTPSVFKIHSCVVIEQNILTTCAMCSVDDFGNIFVLLKYMRANCHLTADNVQ